MNQLSTVRELRKYISTILRWYWLISLCIVAAGTGAFTASKLQQPVYRATTLLIVDEGAVGQETYNNVLASSQLVTSYVTLILQPGVMQVAAHQVGGISATDLRNHINVSAQDQTQIIQIQADANSPSRAAMLANAVAAAFITTQQQSVERVFRSAMDQLNQQMVQTTAQINVLTKQITALQVQQPQSATLPTLQQELNAAQTQRATEQSVIGQMTVQNLTTINGVRVVQPALPPNAPDHPKAQTYILGGVALGFVLSIVAVLLLESRGRIRTEEDLEQLTGLSAIGAVDALPQRHKLAKANAGTAQQMSHTLLTNGGNTQLAESFRILRTHLSFAGLDRSLRTILVTSPMAGEGKTTTAINLAISLAHSGKRVLLVDADLRHPSVHTFLDIPNANGISGCLVDEQPVSERDIPIVTLPSVPNLSVLTSGSRPTNPTELLGSQAMHQVIDVALAPSRTGRSVDLVILDSPPVLSVADASVLAGLADGTILVVDASRSREVQVLCARDALSRVHARILGVVVNRISQKGSDGYYYIRNSVGQANEGHAPSRIGVQ